MKVKIKKYGENPILPKFMHDGDAAADCYASINPGEKIVISPKGRAQVPLGFALELEEGWEAQIRPRSGLSKRGIDVCFGTGDAGYRGEYMATISNTTDTYFTVNPGDRICQIAIRAVPKVEWDEVSQINMETDRGEGGFGSTGMK